MSEIPLNKFEKHALVIRLLKEGKTYREICHIAHIAPRDIKLISKKYKQQKRLEQNKKENNNNNKSSQIKKLSLSSQAFKLFKEGKKPTEVAIILDIQYPKVSKFWYQFLKLEGMEDCYEFYKEHGYDIPRFLSINTFMKRNNMSGEDVVNVLHAVNDVINLNNVISNLKAEINRLEQKKINLSYYSHSGYSLQPLPFNKPNYNYYYY